MGEINGFTAMLAVDELWNQTCIQRTRSIQRKDRRNIFQRRRFQIPDNLPHSTGFQLKDPFKITTRQKSKGFRIFCWQLVWINALPTTDFHQFKGLIDHGEIFQAQEVHLE